MLSYIQRAHGVSRGPDASYWPRLGVRGQVRWIPRHRREIGRQAKSVSRRRNSFNRQYSLVFEALADLPDNTVIDGEVVALNESGRPDFNLLQHYRAEASRIHYFVFDLLVYNNRDLTRLSLVERRQIMKSV